MSIFDNPGYLKSLQELLSSKQNNESSDDSDEDNQVERKPLLGNCWLLSWTLIYSLKFFFQGCIKEDNKKTAKEEEEVPKKSKQVTVDSWLEEQQKEDELLLETRKVPNYKISYKQAVGTEDLFLQMGNKTSSTISCEEILISIELPEETVQVDQMDLDITENEIDLKTPVYRLKIPLVHSIEPDIGNAKYDTENKLLTLTLKMKREFDFVNF